MPRERPHIDNYPFLAPITTRWSDNDVYGHINNVAYYGFFDTAVNLWLIREGGLDPARSDAIGLVVESRCEYHVPLTYPVALKAGVRVEKLGHRAVTYAVAIFGDGDPLAAAHGHFVHVFVERSTRMPVPIPARLRDALMRLLTPKLG